MREVTRGDPAPNSTQGSAQIPLRPQSRRSVHLQTWQCPGPCSAQGAEPPAIPALAAFGVGTEHQRPQKLIPATREALQISLCYQSAKAGPDPSAGITPARPPGRPSPAASVPGPDGLGAQPRPQGAAVARGVLPRQSRGYGSGSLRHLEKNGDVH